jgi:hypothetical protein
MTFTVLYIDGAFVVSRGRWHSPRDGYRARRGEWAWCGSPGWFATEEIRQRYNLLATLVDLTHWHDGEWDTFEAPCFPGLEERASQ